MLILYAILTAFWIEVKLIPILKLLCLISPVSLFIINKALIRAECNVGEFKLVDKKKKD